MIVRKLAAAALAAGAAAVLAGPAAAGGHELGELKAQIEALQKRVAEMEAKEKAMAKPVVAGQSGGSWKVPGSDTSISFSGYVKADLVYDTGNDGGETFAASGIALGGAEDADKGKFGFTARQSRIRFDSRTATEMGTVSTRLETDFYGGGNALRLRHAYGSLGPVMAGQNWTIFGDEDTYASTLDFDGPVGVASARRPQIRYSMAPADGVAVQLAIEENAGGTVLGSRAAAGNADHDHSEGGGDHSHPAAPKDAALNTKLPTFLAALRYRPGWGAVNLTTALRQVEYQDKSATAYAGHIGAHVNATPATQVLATFNYSHGAPDFILGAGTAAALVGGDLKLQKAWGGMVGIKHAWSDTLRSNLYVGYVKPETDDGIDAALAAGQNASLRTVHVNLLWNPAPKTTVGVEFIHGQRKTNPNPDGETKGQDSRVQVSFQYSF